MLGGDPNYCNIMHADGAGTKASLAYMYWKETGDLSVWKVGYLPESTHNTMIREVGRGSNGWGMEEEV